MISLSLSSPQVANVLEAHAAGKGSAGAPAAAAAGGDSGSGNKSLDGFDEVCDFFCSGLACHWLARLLQP